MEQRNIQPTITDRRTMYRYHDIYTRIEQEGVLDKTLNINQEALVDARVQRNNLVSKKVRMTSGILAIVL